MIRVLVFLLGLAGPVHGQSLDLPALFDVAGVAANDFLNVRAGPGTENEVVGRLAYNDTGIEVIKSNGDGSWGLVAMGEGEGWVALRFMERQPGSVGGVRAYAMLCTGTEPFWAFQIKGEEMIFFDTEGRNLPDTIIWDAGPEGLQPVARAIGFSSGHAIVEREICSDGMSERPYGLSVSLILDEPEKRFLSGCCSLQMPR
ncbi:MAG: SH3 domain-containing protein [Rhodobacteraceae bacterium]|nr:SH3 domain-containing protein [Paracoccaceae bacterium]